MSAFPRTAVSLAASATAAALLLTACSAGSETSGDPASDGTAPLSPSVSSSSSPAASPSSTTRSSESPKALQLTEQGAQLSFGQPATVEFTPRAGKGSALRLTVRGVRQGKLGDFDGFILDDTYKRKASYYYARVTVTNVGTGDVGGEAVPLWGLNAKNILLPAVNFTTEFPTCPTRKLPETFGSGQSMRTCLVYLSPDKGKLTAVSFRPDKEFTPINWDGVVEPPATGKKAAGKKAAGKKAPGNRAKAKPGKANQ